MTALQVGRPGRYGLTCFENILPLALRAAGHEVEHRPVEPGEPLGGYDAVLVGVLGPASVVSRNRYRWGALDVIGLASGESRGLGLYVTDWEMRRIDRDLRYLLGEPGRLNSHLERERDHAWAEANLDHLLGVVQMLAEGPWPVTLVPRFTWGNGELLVDAVAGLTSENVMFLDPSALVPAVPAPVYAQRDRHETWVVAALARPGRDWASRFATAWPKAILATRVPETEFLRALGACAGTLAWPHPHAGSGWWRIRHVFASRLGSVICANPDEVAELGDVFAWKPGDVETLTPDDRQNLAAWQQYELERRAWPLERLVYEADQVLRRIVAGSVG